jgi:hypothetical protein
VKKHALLSWSSFQDYLVHFEKAQAFKDCCLCGNKNKNLQKDEFTDDGPIILGLIDLYIQASTGTFYRTNGRYFKKIIDRLAYNGPTAHYSKKLLPKSSIYCLKGQSQEMFDPWFFH